MGHLHHTFLFEYWAKSDVVNGAFRCWSHSVKTGLPEFSRLMVPFLKCFAIGRLALRVSFQGSVQKPPSIAHRPLAIKKGLVLSSYNQTEHHVTARCI